MGQRGSKEVMAGAGMVPARRMARSSSTEANQMNRALTSSEGAPRQAFRDNRRLQGLTLSQSAVSVLTRFETIDER